MCRSVENLTRRYEQRGEQRGRRSQAIATAQVLLEIGKNTLDEIAKISGLTLDEVKTIAQLHNA